MRRLFRFLLLFFVVVLCAPAALVFVLSFFNGHTTVSQAVEQSVLLNAPPAPLKQPLELKVVTFNIQDLPFVSEHRAERMKAIFAKLLVLDPDVVGFQEAFLERDRDMLLGELLNTRLVNTQYFGSGRVGSGLLIASAWPIREAWFHQYRASAPWYKLWEGDFWAGKGVAVARIALENGDFFDFFNTHAQAGYGNPAYKLVREAQMREMADFVQKAHVSSIPAIVVGDLNCRVGDQDYQGLVDGAGLERLMTLDSRIDHILGKNDPQYAFEVLETREIAESVSVNGKQFELSDHTGYMSTIRISRTGEQE